MSKTITVNVEEEVEHEFRKRASQRYGIRKGYLGRALTEAMKEWVKSRNADIEAESLMLLQKGIMMKKWRFERGELNER